MCCNAGIYGCDWGWCGFRREFARLKIEKESPLHQRQTLSREPLLECSFVSAVRSKVSSTSSGKRVRCESRSNFAGGISKPFAETIDKNGKKESLSDLLYQCTQRKKNSIAGYITKRMASWTQPGKVSFRHYSTGFSSGVQIILTSP